MNRLEGIIKDVKSVDGITQIFINIGDEILSSLILSGNEEYKKGEIVNLLFKETEVMIATKKSKVSARNSFVSKIADIQIGEILCCVEFLFGENKIVSIITKGALEDLKCNIGDEFMWFVKSNEISIQRG